MFEKIIFYIYTVVSSDPRREINPRDAEIKTIFLISFTQILLCSPILLWINKALNPVNLLSYGILTRYFFIALFLTLIFLINFYTWGRSKNMERIKNKLENKKDQYLKYKWMFLFFVLIMMVFILLAITLIR